MASRGLIMRDGFFYPILTLIIDYFSCSPISTAFSVRKSLKRLQKILNSLRCDMVISFNITMMSRVDVRLFVFYLSLGLVWVCEINRTHHWCSPNTRAHSSRYGGPDGWDFFRNHLTVMINSLSHIP